MAKSRPSSSESPDDLESTDGAVNVSPPCDSEVTISPSQTRSSRRDFIMMPPEEKLRHFDRRARAHEDNQECDACIRDLVRCLALTRLVHRDSHLKLAQAHARLAKAYLQFKGYGLQAQEHCALARELLPFRSAVCREEKLEVLTCLLSVHLTQGSASLLTANLNEAESSFLEAEQVAEELHQGSGINQEEKTKAELEISQGLFRVYQRQNRADEALSCCEKSLQLLEDSGQPEKTSSVYNDMATIEQDKGHMDRAVELLTKAHAIAVSHGPEELEGAQISHRLALMLAAAAEPHHNDSAGQYFEQSLSAYKNCAGPESPAFLTAQDDFCRYLLVSGQQERCVEIQKASLPAKTSAFGELSAEVADTLQLLGSVEMTQGKAKQAHRTMTKCLKIQSLLYGSQHKKTKATQKAVDMLAREPEVAERQREEGRRKTKLHAFNSVVPSSGNDGNSVSNS